MEQLVTDAKNEEIDTISMLNRYITGVDNNEIIGDNAKYFGQADELYHSMMFGGSVGDSVSLEVMNILITMHISW